jgi:uncharacterized protein (TIGR02996 family)
LAKATEDEPMTPVEALQHALQLAPEDDTAWLALADCLAERGEEGRSELVRLQLSLRQKPDAPEAAAWEERLRQLWSEGAESCQPVMAGPHGMRFVLVPPGSFWMGATPGEEWMDDDETPRRIVRLTRGFWLGTHPVTQSQWRAVMGDEPHRNRGEQRPAEMVSHDDAVEFCSRLTNQLGRVVRLPTEAEWEYAARAGTTTPYCSGTGVEALRLVGWCSYSGKWDSSGGPRKVGSLRPNSWGLYDMHGNVWEWCQDRYAEDAYRTGPSDDPTGPPSGQDVVVRGGSWRGGPWFCRSAERRAESPETRAMNIGFRVVVEVG